MPRSIEVKTTSRLHFGLTTLGHGAGRQFGGVGVMVDTGGVALRLTAADRFQVDGSCSDRVEQIARRFAKARQLAALPDCRIEVGSAPMAHVGLGSGTQLAIAVAAAMAEFLESEWRDATLLSQLTGRGKRSAIGTYGFLHGGLLVDGGKLPDEPVGQLVERIEFPADWQFVLIQHPQTRGLAGNEELAAMRSLPPVPTEVTQELRRITKEEIVPAAQTADLRRFGEAVYAYGRLAGECFAAVQGGPFASTEVATLVEWVRDRGYSGTGQSSWGPTTFVIAENRSSADVLVALLRDHRHYREYECTIAPAANRGACVVASGRDGGSN